MAISKIPSAGFQDNVKFRNIIINGDMSIAQRGTSASSLTSSGYHTVDRYRTRLGSIGTWTQSQSTDVPTGQGFATSLKMDCTTANASPSASASLSIQHKIEGQNLQYLKKGTSSAESTTLSFWVKSNKTGTYIAELFDNDNQRQISQTYTISSADTWEKKTLTFAGDTTGALGNDNGNSFLVEFWLGAGSNYTSGTLNTSWNSNTNTNRVVGSVNLADSTSNEWYITGVQLEAGEVASDFEFLPHDVNLERCQRYYEHSFQDGTAYGTSTNVGKFLFGGSGNLAGREITVYLKKTKRAIPTITFTQTTVDGGGSISSNSFTSDKYFCAVASSSGRQFFGHFKAEAEL